jgi:hypothetical protein
MDECAARRENIYTVYEEGKCWWTGCDVVQIKFRKRYEEMYTI